MLPFTSRLKLYLFKNQNRVSLSIKVSDNYVNGFSFVVEDFEKIIQSWKQPKGIDMRIDGAHWHINHKSTTPRPECAKTSYVRISVHPPGPVAHHYRVSYEDMYNLEKDYFYQKNNEMYWDNDV